MKYFLIHKILQIFYFILSTTVKINEKNFHLIHHAVTTRQGCLVAVVHHALLGASLSLARKGAVSVASQSQDGELIARVLERHGMEVVRGSSSRGGRNALIELIKKTEEGKAVGITFDGPKGPPLIPKKGVSVCAQVCQGPVLFLRLKPSEGWRGKLCLLLKSWDRFLLLLPFSSIDCELICLDEGTLDERNQPGWTETINRKIEQEARDFYGDLYIGWTKGLP